MHQGEQRLKMSEIYEVLKFHDVTVNTIKLYWENSDISTYLVDNKYILKISTSVLDEQTKQDRVKAIPFASKIHISGTFVVSDCDYHYVMTDYIQGNELWSVAQKITEREKRDIGKDIAHFLNELHLITDDAYDIGHYVPTVPRFNKTWKEGHLEYVSALENGLSKMDVDLTNRKIIAKAFDYIHSNIDALEYQEGARLLHNDFHPKNIIVHEGRLAGVIDWECSQFGEADFDLVHLFCWCIYPEKYLDQKKHLEALIKSVIYHLSLVSMMPDMEKRMTIYQLEHEVNQLIWNGKTQEEERINRINEWLAGKAYTFLNI